MDENLIENNYCEAKIIFPMKIINRIHNMYLNKMNM